MSNSNKSTTTGIGFPGVLLIVFIVLKLTKVIEWSWWWVLAPFWIPFGLVILFLTIIAIAKGLSK
ncbi:hypothetical protein EGI16_21355 [Chryseobacterium sp. G0240]|uniref:hypothetical protein n=1 Tax=Chryseobacterium sp. G0240 TaxID=2487066 RepID=UPI000F454632|nr:hypothetical protein [Chryseobacterium sp. G0240]ROH98385.1 hypothetical protein EGI16_21355 [Chryseobacterium sp. G0240]